MTTQPCRLPQDRAAAPSLDRQRPLSFTIDGQQLSGLAGDTLASALLAHGRIACGGSMYLGRPRGILSAGVEEPNALVRLAARRDEDVAESMLPATAVELTDGMEATWLSGLGQLDPKRDEAVYDHRNIHAAVVILDPGPPDAAQLRVLDPGHEGCVLHRDAGLVLPAVDDPGAHLIGVATSGVQTQVEGVLVVVPLRADGAQPCLERLARWDHAQISMPSSATAQPAAETAARAGERESRTGFELLRWT